MAARIPKPSTRRTWAVAAALIALAAVFTLAGCSSGKKASGPPPVQGTPTQTADGLQIIDINAVPGGAVATNGRVVRVNFTGWLADGTEFENSAEHGQPFVFILGNEPPDVIEGWNEGIVGMTVGSKRRLIVPPELAYGAEGSPPDIPPSAQLIYDIELVGVQ